MRVLLPGRRLPAKVGTAVGAPRARGGGRRRAVAWKLLGPLCAPLLGGAGEGLLGAERAARLSLLVVAGLRNSRRGKMQLQAARRAPGGGFYRSGGAGWGPGWERGRGSGFVHFVKGDAGGGELGCALHPLGDKEQIALL